MLMQLTLPLPKLLAANVCASKDETRYYLNGVCLHFTRDGVINIVATDGHRLIKMTEQGEKLTADLTVILPRELLARIKAKRMFDDCYLTFDTDTMDVSIEYDNNTFKDKLIDGTYPDYQRVIPDPKTFDDSKGVAEIGFNPAYIADFAKINAILGHKNEPVRMSFGEHRGPVRVTHSIRDLYLGILMPLRV